MIIGEPTIGRWLTAVLYLLTAVSCLAAARKLQSDVARSREVLLWQLISLLVLALCIFRELDHLLGIQQTLRALAYSEKWYEQRRIIQRAFIGCTAMTCVGAGLFLLTWARKSLLTTTVALAGAISIHSIDLFLRDETRAGLHWGWIFETSAICAVLLPSLWIQLGGESSTQ